MRRLELAIILTALAILSVTVIILALNWETVSDSTLFPTEAAGVDIEERVDSPSPLTEVTAIKETPTDTAQLTLPETPQPEAKTEVSPIENSGLENNVDAVITPTLVDEDDQLADEENQLAGEDPQLAVEDDQSAEQDNQLADENNRSTRTSGGVSGHSPLSSQWPALTTTSAITINGIPYDTFVVLPDVVKDNVRTIFTRGQSLGRDGNAFSRLGASVIETDQFLTPFDGDDYDLGPYDFLQPTIDYFEGSFEWMGVAIRRGLNALAVFNPLWADKEQCTPNETMVDCEFRLQNPSILIIVLGTNDIGTAADFENNLSDLIEQSIDYGVIPILTTKADRFEGDDNRNNIIIRKLAAEYEIPLWDYDPVAETLPGKGLGSDGVHMTFFYEFDYSLPKAFTRGYGLYNLTALMMLDAVRREIILVESNEGP